MAPSNLPSTPLDDHRHPHDPFALPLATFEADIANSNRAAAEYIQGRDDLRAGAFMEVRAEAAARRLAVVELFRQDWERSRGRQYRKRMAVVDAIELDNCQFVRDRMIGPRGLS